jgi:hypothetical protein
MDAMSESVVSVSILRTADAALGFEVLAEGAVNNPALMSMIDGVADLRDQLQAHSR